MLFILDILSKESLIFYRNLEFLKRKSTQPGVLAIVPKLYIIHTDCYSLPVNILHHYTFSVMF